MQNIINNAVGYVRVELTSPFPERFINICAQHGIPVWGVERTGALTLRASVRRDAFKKLLPFAARGMGQLKVVGKHGLPFFLWRFRKRYALLAGFLLTACGLFILSQFIWEMEVTGNQTVTQESILRELEDLGVGIGVYRHGFSSSELQHHMLLRIPELEWFAINTTGSRAIIEVRERVPKPDIVPQNQPCNIVASKSGMILSINTLEGAAQVKTGQTVEAGELLVSGLLNSEIIGYREVHALANVHARTWYDFTAVMPLKSSGKAYTGRTHTRYALSLGKLRINFYKDSSQIYQNCDKIVRQTALKVPPGLTLPVSLTAETFTEYQTTPYVLDSQMADAYLRNVLGGMLHEVVGTGEIVAADFVSSPGSDVLICSMTAECVEQIAETVPIPQ